MADSERDDDWLIAGSTDLDAVAGYYDEWAERYDDDLDTWEYHAPDVVARLLTEHAPHAAVVLDAGCGTGRSGRAIRRAGFVGELHGVDLSEASLTVAERSGAYTSLARADLQQPLDNDDDSVDAIACVGVMTYVPEVEACWRDWCRVVRPGGLITVTQRSDLWEPRDCQAIVDRLAAEGVWEPIWVSGVESYLPGNDGFGDEIGVRYVAARVR